MGFFRFNAASCWGFDDNVAEKSMRCNGTATVTGDDSENRPADEVSARGPFPILERASPSPAICPGRRLIVVASTHSFVEAEEIVDVVVVVVVVVVCRSSRLLHSLVVAA